MKVVLLKCSDTKYAGEQAYTIFISRQDIVRRTIPSTLGGLSPWIIKQISYPAINALEKVFFIRGSNWNRDANSLLATLEIRDIFELLLFGEIDAGRDRSITYSKICL